MHPPTPTSTSPGVHLSILLSVGQDAHTSPDVCICVAQGVALLEVVALLEEVWACWRRYGLVGVDVVLLE